MTRQEFMAEAKALPLNGPMALAFRSGLKTQSMRPVTSIISAWENCGKPLHPQSKGQFFEEERDLDFSRFPKISSRWKWPSAMKKPGTKVWVREPGKYKWLGSQRNFAWCKYSDEESCAVQKYVNTAGLVNGQGFPNGIPKVFARTFAEVTMRAVMVLSDLSDEQAASEGIRSYTDLHLSLIPAYREKYDGRWSIPTAAFFCLWDSIYGKPQYRRVDGKRVMTRPSLSVENIGKTWPGLVAFNRYNLIKL